MDAGDRHLGAFQGFSHVAHKPGPLQRCLPGWRSAGGCGQVRYGGYGQVSCGCGWMSVGGCGHVKYDGCGQVSVVGVVR